jgi:Ran GTPase-activating protein (RanGAP) involved in mRNA processing and transport
MKTLTVLDLGGNQIGEKGAQYLSNRLKDNMVTLIWFSPIHVSIYTILNRHLPNSISLSIKLEPSEQDIWPLRYEITWSLLYLFNILHIYLHFYIQTLAMLYLHSNQIGAVGAQSLANALQNNTVTFNCSSFLLYPYLLFLQRHLSH